MSFYKLRDEFTLYDRRTAISREDFEAHFHRTNEKVRFSFNGWDGKSYDGESRVAYVYKTDVPGYTHFRFIKVGKAIHGIEEFHYVLEKATGKHNLSVSWLVDVLRRSK